MHNHHHKINQTPEYFLGRLATRRQIRFWFADGCVFGIWQSNGGRTCAVARNAAGHTIIYPTISPFDNWQGRNHVRRMDNNAFVPTS